MKERKEDIGEKKRKRYSDSHYNKYMYIHSCSSFFLLKITMTVVSKTNTTEFNEIFTNPESQNESDAETESESEISEYYESDRKTEAESEISEYSDSDVKSPMEVSDNEDVSSSSSLNFASRLWSRSNFKPKLFQFQNGGCRIACDSNGVTIRLFQVIFSSKIDSNYC